MSEAVFTYEQFHVAADRRTVEFAYCIDHDGTRERLVESLVFPVDLPESAALGRVLRALHLALGISYYKIFAGPTIAQPYAMQDDEAQFWNDIWRNGLGEFLYINKLSPDVLAQFSAQTGLEFPASEPAHESADTATAILGIGGGKDSAVAGELLKQSGVKLEGFVMATGEQLGQTQAVAQTMGVPLHIVERRLDKQLLALQELPGTFKGHVPISLIFGLVGTALAAATGAPYVVVANEASASIPRIAWEHGSVNHQWSKSFGFEQQLQSYVQVAISPSITYFSAVRQLTSVGVAKIFASFPQYYEVFTSDNSVFRMDPAARPHARWSLESPKSLSSFILLAPWLSEADLLCTFGRDFLNEASLKPLFKELVGLEGEPPLDCVGTVEELVLSLNLAAQQAKFGDSYLLGLARDQGVIAARDWTAELAQMLTLQPESAVPQALAGTITDLLQKDLAA